ncbi:hypothetical protein K461DRAFT_304019 [Myriangium duriaei CBS 260.36]|uniref:Rhodopsin domain-containing protein n=1 Tax=Myriangium duriaei CBS 260.36 TaxID=1168546 RepID=A0A9P4J3V9_9PEZI|nr:hypothetical protein K461DRAFT_304019 [Myriangium duriaei CBS 260.36]
MTFLCFARHQANTLSDFNLYDAATISYLLSTVLLKLSLACFYSPFLLSPWHRPLITSITSLSAALGSTLACIILFNCGLPTDKLLKFIEGKCLSTRVILDLNYAYIVVDTISSWIFALIPILAVRAMTMPTPEKVSVMLILGLGVVGAFCCVVRVPYVHGFDTGKTSLGTSGSREGYPSPALAIVSVAEVGLGIICASGAACRPYFQRGKRGVQCATTPDKSSSGAGLMQSGGLNVSTSVHGRREQV